MAKSKWKNPQKSYISKVRISDFRLIDNIDFEPGKNLNLLVGKNGTAKSTVLGMIAQGFSFNPSALIGVTKSEFNIINQKKNLTAEEITLREDYINFLTYSGKNYESKVNEHFKLSESDVTKKEHAVISLKDLNNKITQFKIGSNNYNDRTNPRLVTRRSMEENEEKGSKDTSSSNIIFPVIYLGLNRVSPIVQSNNLKPTDLGLPTEDENELFSLYESILLKKYENNFKGISNNKDKRTVAFIPENRSLEMISSGEDNIGQILLAIFSFKKLKENYKNYKGGILLIDEIDATLYPAAQKKLINVLYKKSIEYGFQVFCTTHSLSLIEETMKIKLGIKTTDNRINIFNLNADTYKLEVSKVDNLSKLTNEFFVLPEQDKVPEKIPFYFEDKEAIFVFDGLITNRKLRNFIKIERSFSLGCNELKKLHSFSIPEFKQKAIVCLDGDNKLSKGLKNFIVLPSINGFPPERFIYEIISNSNSEYWGTTKNYNYGIFMNNPHYDTIQLIIQGAYGNEDENDNGPYNIPGSGYHRVAPRVVWKQWFKAEKSNFIGNNNPVKYWKTSNENSKEFIEFHNSLEKAFKFVAKNKGIDIPEIKNIF
ncbi:AAA family ATPase [Listeria marthii]|uniref:AAA family ATPase n=1 Tax=Listeria marthii TaxID=529731 RepID=UPI0016258439|nr:AAA family ATPase [Listeria marthii]MBC2101541.1 AAA family ATPase [Listeria marthii]HBM3796062.1 AAA family ATPase [Listeria innocua]